MKKIIAALLLLALSACADEATKFRMDAMSFKIERLEDELPKRDFKLESDVSSLIFALEKLGLIEWTNEEIAGRRFYPKLKDDKDDTECRYVKIGDELFCSDRLSAYTDYKIFCNPQ